MFDQGVADGAQIERPDCWLRDGNPWELERRQDIRTVQFGGTTQPLDSEHQDDLSQARLLTGTKDVLAVPFDVPVPGYRNDCVNTLRLWKAEAIDEFDLARFNAGEHVGALSEKSSAERITMVLYPEDGSESGKELRLRQQYFLVSASLQDVLARWVEQHGANFDKFAEKNCFQLNDTHPSCSVAELMRLLIDEQSLGWEQAWAITSQCMAYTNHTLLPEALEKWPVRLFRRLLPRLLEIIEQIDVELQQMIAQHWPGDDDRFTRMSLFEDGDEPQVRMAYLSLVGSFSVNGVAALHSSLVKEQLFNDFYQLWPEKFNNKTNGVTQRRWLAHCNPLLADHICAAIGDG